MSGRNLGWVPLTKNINLVADTDFVDGIEPPAGETWPGGLVVKIIFNDPARTVFDAVVTPEVISWNIDKAVVNTLMGARPTKANVTYKDGALDMTWMRGDVVRVD